MKTEHHVGPGWQPITQRLEESLNSIDPEAELETSSKHLEMQVRVRLSGPATLEIRREVCGLVEDSVADSRKVCETCGSHDCKHRGGPDG